jgi:Predicted aminoglycoside phosphotransferase
MQTVIDKILNKLMLQLGPIAEVKKINVGFTNTLFLLDNKYILKICTKKENEVSFKKEIKFFLENIDNEYIPKLITYSIDKNDTNHFYEIMEKIDGVSLYNIWHTLSIEQRKDIIKQICDLLKQFHSNQKDSFDWCEYIDEQILIHLEKAKQINYFNKEELTMIDQARLLFSKYLISDDFVFIHGDIHFDNIIYSDGTIKIIDFERSMVAPRDYDLNIFFRMVRMPWKYASEETEKYTNSSDYSMIPTYVKEYYPELLEAPYLAQRLAIYDILDFMEKSYNYPNDLEIKTNIMNSVKTVLYKEFLTFDNISTPNELLQFMIMNIEYGWVGFDNSKNVGNLKKFREQYRTNSIEEILNTGLGTCIESANLAKSWFDRKKIESKLFCHRTYENEENFNKDIKMHIIILFKNNNKWCHLEHSNYPERGIYEYSSVDEAIENITKWFKENNDIRDLTELEIIPDGLSFKEFNNYVNQFAHND